MLEKNAVTSVPIHDLLTRRWSTRAFAASRAVTHREIAALLEAARWAPSCNGGEPWRYLVCEKTSDKDSWQRAFDCLSAGNQLWCTNAPVLLLACTGSTFAHNGQPNRFGQHDTGMATLSLMLQAVALGLATHAMAGFDAEKARSVFSVPPDFTPLTMIAIGQQTDPDVLPEAVKAKELAPRTRRALSDTFFSGSWGSAFKLPG